MASLSELVVVQSKSAVLKRLLSYLSLRGFPVSTWVDGMVSKDVVEWVSAYLSDATALIASLAKGGFLSLAEGDWLDVLGEDFYAETRYAAIAATHYLLLTNTTAAPISVAANSVFETLSGIQFLGGGVTVAAGGTQTIVITADIPGSAGNQALNSIVVCRTSYPGLTVTNAPDAFTGTSLITTGADKESREAYRTRCKAKWGALGTGGTKEAYIYWCRTAVAACTKVLVFPSSPGAGQVRVVVGSDSGPLSVTDLVTVIDYVADRVPLCVTASVENCLTAPVAVLGTVYYDPNFSLASLKAAVYANFYALQVAKDFGQPLYLAELYEAIMSPPGTVNAVITSPASQVNIGSTSMHVLLDPSSMTWVST